MVSIGGSPVPLSIRLAVNKYRNSAAWWATKRNHGKYIALSEDSLKHPKLQDNLLKLLDGDRSFASTEQGPEITCSETSQEDPTIDNVTDSNSILLQSLAVSLSKYQNPTLQTNAAWALAELGRGHQSNKERICNVPGVLDNLLNLVNQDQNFGLAQGGAAAICILAYTQDSVLKSRIASFAPLLEILASSLSKAENPGLQEIAASTLASLACGDQSTREKIFNVPGLMDRLVESIKQEQNSGLAQEAARIVCNLAAFQDSTITGRLVSCPNLLESLAESLHKGKNPALQIKAACALANFGSGKQFIKEKILNLPGLLESLVKSMNQAQNVGLAQQAARAFCMLAATESSTIKCKLAYVPNLLESLTWSLSRVENHALQKNAASALASLACGDQSIKEVFNVPGLLDKLVKSMEQDHVELAQEAARVVCNLTAFQNSRINSKITSFPNLLESLGGSLSKGDNPILQTYAAWALANLGCGHQSVKDKIFNVPELLGDLLKCISQAQNSSLAQQAARAVCNLAATKDSTLKYKIGCYPSLLEILAGSLSKYDNHALQENVASAVASLASGSQSIKEKILNVPELLDRLVKAVEQEQNSSLAQQAARAVCNLAALEDSTINSKIASFPNLLESLAGSLLKGHNPALQRKGTSALANLGSGNQSTKERILNLPGLVDRLVNSVEQDQNFGLAQQAARALCNLAAFQDSTMKDTIVSFPNLLESLAVSLSKVENPALQENAASALANLGCGAHQSIKERILNFPGLLERLVESVDQVQNSGLAQQAARVICNLATTENLPMICKIACYPTLLESLAKSLSKGLNPALQTNAAWALANLGHFEHSIQEKISNIPRILGNLVKSMDQDQNSDLAEHAARVVRNLASTPSSPIKGKIAHFPNLLEILGLSVSKSWNPGLQINAASALVKLGRGVQSVKEKILNLLLVKFVDQDPHFSLAEQMQTSISTKDDKSQNKVGKFLGSSEFFDLMSFFLQEGDRNLQVMVGRLLADLTCTKYDGIRGRLLHFCGDWLGSWFVRREDREHQMEAARALANLTYMKDEPLRGETIQVSAMLKALAKSLVYDQTRKLQEQGPGEVGNLAIAESDRHATGTSQDEICDLQVEAARLLTNWAVSKDDSFKGNIFHSPGMLVWAGEGCTTPYSQPGSRCTLRPDIQSLGLVTWEEQFNPQQMCALYDVRKDRKGVDFMFFHAQAMATFLGVGLQNAIVSVTHDPYPKFVIKEIRYEWWKDEWLDSHKGSFKPMIFQRLEQSSFESGNHDFLDRSGSLRFSTLGRFKHGEADCSISSGYLHKGWIKDIVKCLQHGVDPEYGERNGVKNGEGGSEGDQQGSPRYDQRDSTGHDQGDDTRQNQRDTVDGQGDNTRNGGQGSGIGTSQSVGGGVADGGGNGGAHDGDGQGGGNRGTHDGGGSENSGSENGGGGDPKKLSKDQSSGKVVVHVQLLDESAVCKAYEENLKIEANGGGSDEVHAEGLNLIRTISTIDPTLVIEFLWASKFHKKVSAELAVGYYISNTAPSKKCKWYQNDLQVSFCCTEGRRKIMLDGPPRIISPTAPVPIQTTEKTGQLTSDIKSKRMSGAAGVGLSGNKLQLQFDVGNSSGRTAETGIQAQKSCNYKCLADQSDFVVTSRRKQNNLSFTASYLYHIEPALHWDEKIWCEARPTGLYADVDLSVGGAWVLVDHDDEQLKFKFEATKMLFKCTKPGESADEKQAKPKSKWWGKRSSSSDQGQAASQGETELNQTEPNQVWQGLTRELILDHNFEKFFGKLEWCSPHYIKDPLPETIDVIREVLKKIERSYTCH